ncbi:MAG: helix-turn-helix domain-containing protein [Oscillospiraceae bacterium]|nr:helix-turn-helix domain-containing protein [Oscillospiraceae bacterium]
MNLAEKLTFLRKEKHMSQLELAEVMNVSRQAVSRWETGASTPSTENLRLLGELYGVTLEYLLNDSEELCYAYTVNLDAQLGLLDTETGNLYTVALARAFSEGSTGEKTLKLSDENIPAGVYDVVVVCPAGAEYTISAAVNFEWKQSQDTA